jgi:REP element-mobilizing transposase RayT
MPDHIHLLVRLHPATSVSALVKDVKGASSHFVRSVLSPGAPFQWQTGYGAFSVGVRDIPRTRDYIQHQERHHRGGSVIAAMEALT